jgi:hypothetical protein
MRIVSRLGAFAVHLAISLVIFVGILYLIVFHWYPQPYFAADGGWQGIRLMFVVDVVLGPLLTAMVYKPGKPGLRFDLAMIALAQCVALVLGGWTVYQQRTALVVFVDDAFAALNPAQVEQAGLDINTLSRFSDTHPPMAFLRLPEDQTERRQFIRDQEFKRATPVIRLGDRYEPMTPGNLDTLLSRGMDIEEWSATDAAAKRGLDEFLRHYGGSVADYAFLPIHCRYRHGVLAMRRSDGKVVAMPDITIPNVY